MLIAVTFVKGCCGFERDGSFATKKGIWDEDGIDELSTYR